MTDIKADVPFNVPSASTAHGATGAVEVIPAEIPVIAILVGLALMMQIAINVMIPALPNIAAELAATPLWSKLTLTSFIVGYGLSPLVLGPLTDRFGRRPVLIAGLSLYTLA